jgi:hypothetical protein
MTISFKQFLSELIIKDARVKKAKAEPELQRLERILNKHCSEAFEQLRKSRVGYYRAQNGAAGSPIMISDSTKSQRLSRDTNNLYQVMMDASPALQSFPSRSNSTIVSTNYAEVMSLYALPTEDGNSSRAAKRKSIYVVLPFNGTKIVESDKDDFITHNVDFFGSFVSLSEISRIISSVLEQLRHPSHVVNHKAYNPDNSRKYTSAALIDEVLDKLTGESFYTLVKNNWFANRNNLNKLEVNKFFDKHKFGRFTALAAQLMTPSNLGLKIISPSDKPKRDVECWFSGKALFVNIDLMEKLLQQNISDEPESVQSGEEISLKDL